MFEVGVAKSLETANDAIKIAMAEISKLRRQLMLVTAERDLLAEMIKSIEETVAKKKTDGQSP